MANSNKRPMPTWMTKPSGSKNDVKEDVPPSSPKKTVYSAVAIVPTNFPSHNSGGDTKKTENKSSRSNNDVEAEDLLALLVSNCDDNEEAPDATTIAGETTNTQETTNENTEVNSSSCLEATCDPNDNSPEVNTDDLHKNAAISPNPQVNADSSCQNISPVAVAKRDSCFYGSSCYRRNPQHRIQFCHPGDADYAEASTSAAPKESLPVCQYGAKCYRKNPQHRRDYRHDTPNERTTKKRKARPDNMVDFTADSDNDGEDFGASSSDDFNPDDGDTDDSFVTSDSVESENSEYTPGEDGSDEEKGKRKKKKSKKSVKKRKKN